MLLSPKGVHFAICETLSRALGIDLVRKRQGRGLVSGKGAAYKRGHDDVFCDHYSNYFPGALT